MERYCFNKREDSSIIHMYHVPGKIMHLVSMCGKYHHGTDIPVDPIMTEEEVLTSYLPQKYSAREHLQYCGDCIARLYGKGD